MSISDQARSKVHPPRCPHCGSTKQGKPRSVEQHRRYFALMNAAFTHWPEAHERQFSSAEELRKYYQMKAGHREVGASIPLTGINKDKAMLLAEASIRAAGSYAVPVLYKDTLVVFRPLSISFEKLPHKDACKLFDDVSALIESDIGIPAETLMKETENAA